MGIIDDLPLSLPLPAMTPPVRDWILLVFEWSRRREFTASNAGLDSFAVLLWGVYSC